MKIVLIAAALLGASSADAAIMTSDLRLATAAGATAPDGATINPPQFMEFGQVPLGYTVYNSATQLSTPTASAYVQSGIATNFLSAGSGAIQFTQAGSLALQPSSDNGRSLAGSAQEQDVLVYDFESDSPFVLTLTYFVSLFNNGSSFSQNIQVTGEHGAVFARSGSGAGTFTSDLLSAGSYTLAITGTGSQVLAGAGIAGGSASGYYQFSTADPAAVAGAVPEPGSWALTIAGIGLVGGVTRRRSRVAVAAT